MMKKAVKKTATKKAAPKKAAKKMSDKMNKMEKGSQGMMGYGSKRMGM